ncbi:predicted protein [Postia placenta Mad-698-R]|nr:predicted protein [Postia placenta Mad-698-R]
MADSPQEGNQCRICFDGEDPELGRLIRPCLCKGSISCGYKYHFARTRVVGIATNPDDERETTTYLYGVYSPVDVIQGLVRATVNTFVDDKLLDDTILSKGPPSSHIRAPGKPPGLLKRLVRRFLLGLPVVGAGSIAHMLLSIPLPFHWVRLRTINRGRDSRDIMALIIVTVVLIGAARALYKVYRLTERLTQRLLLRAEDAILEVA